MSVYNSDASFVDTLRAAAERLDAEGQELEDFNGTGGDAMYYARLLMRAADALHNWETEIAAARRIEREQCALLCLALTYEKKLDARSMDVAAAEIRAGHNAADWQPISTAPREPVFVGSKRLTRRVLCYAPANGDYPYDRMRVDWWEGGSWWGMTLSHPYTHWMPLPAPPQDETP